MLLLKELSVGFGDLFGATSTGDMAILKHDGAIAEAKDIFHGMGDEDDGLLAVERGEIIITFLLEGSVTNGEDFVKDEDVALGADSNREGEADLHTGRVVFELLVHKIFELGEFDNIVIHSGDLGITEAEHGAVQIDVLATSEFHIETDTKFDEGDEITIDGDLAGAGIINTGENFQEGGLAGAITANDANEFAFFDFKIDVIKDLLVTIAFDAAETIEDGLLETPGTFGGETEGFGKMADRDSDGVLVVVGFDASADNAFTHLDFLREKARSAPENYSADDKNSKGEKNGEDLAPGTIEAEIGDAGVGDEAPAGVLDDLGNGVEQEKTGGEEAGVGDHGDGVDNRDGIEESLE